MKRILMMAATAMMVAISLTLAGCADADEGENKDDWELRNTINGPTWHVDKLKGPKGDWVDWAEANAFYFEVKFSASNHNFKSEKFYYKEYMKDDSTYESYGSADNTAFTIKDAKIIEATVNGESYFRITLHKKVTSTMECSLYFYRENRTFEVIMTR